MKKIGILLAIVGIVMMLVTGFNFVTQKKVLDIGDIKIKKDENHSVQWSPAIGVLLLVGGVIIYASNKAK